MLIIRGGIHKMLVWIANRENPDQTASLETDWSGSALFGVLQETSVRNFIRITVRRDNCLICKCNVNHYHARYFSAYAVQSPQLNPLYLRKPLNNAAFHQGLHCL